MRVERERERESREREKENRNMVQVCNKVALPSLRGSKHVRRGRVKAKPKLGNLQKENEEL